MSILLVAYLGFPLCFSLVKRIRPQEYLAIQSSCEKWFIIFINSWCWNTLLIDDFVFRLRSLLYNLEGVANIGVIDGVADAAFYNLFGYGGMQFVQLIDPPCSNVALLRNGNMRNLLPYFDAQKITRELISLVGNYEQDGCKLQKFAIQEKIDTSAIFDSCYFWVVFETSKKDQSTYDQCYNDYVQLARHFEGDYRFAFIPTNKPVQGCLVSVYGLNKQQPTRFNLVTNGMAALYGVPSFLDEYRSRYRPCSTNPWKPVDMYTVMASCKFWIVASVAQDSDWPCVREIEKFAVYSKDNFEFGYVKGPTFGVWLFLENKLSPVLAMSDPVACNVPAVFDIMKGQLNKVPPPSDQICDNYAISPLYDVDESIAILNQKKLMDSWDNWIVLQLSPFTPNYPEMYTEFKNLANQFKGSIRFGFMPNSQFGLWLYGRNKNWPYLITSDTNDFQTERYMSMLLDLLNGRGVDRATPSSISPYVGAPQNFLQNLQPQVPLSGPFYPSTGVLNPGASPKLDLYGSRSLAGSDNLNPNALKNALPTANTGTVSPDAGKKNCNQSKDHGSGENVFDSARGLGSVSSTDDGASEEYILEPVLNLATFPDKWKAGLDELFSKSKDLVVRVSFPNPKGRNKAEPKDQVKLKLDGAKATDALPAPLSTTAISSERADHPIYDAARILDLFDSNEETTSIAPESNTSIATESLNMVTIPLVTDSVTVDNTSRSSEAKEILETTSGTVTESVEGEKETSATAEISTEASSTTSMDMSSPSSSEASIATAERTVDATDSTQPPEGTIEASPSTESGLMSTTESITTDGGSPAPSATEYVVTEASVGPSDVTTLTAQEATTDASGARGMGDESTVGTEAGSTTEITIETTIETTSEPTKESTSELIAESTSELTTSPTTEVITESTSEPSTAPTSELTKVSTTEPTTEVAITETTTPPRNIETTDVETVRKDCKFWVLISSSGTKETDEKYDGCYQALTHIMQNYKNIYKFGAVQTGEFFINLYLRNKSNPVLIATDYACDEKKIKSALDAHIMENPGEFCQDPEDISDLSTTAEPITLPTQPTQVTSTVAPDCSLQLVVRYPKKEAKKYQSCIAELSKVINSKQTKWQLKEEDRPAFSVNLWTTTGVKPLMNFRLSDCKVDMIEKSINKVVTTNTPMCAYSHG